MWPAIADAPDVSRVRAPRFLGAHTCRHGNALRREPRVALPGDLGIGVFQRGDDARDARRRDRIHARRRLAVVRAGLERRIERGAARSRAGAPQRLDLGMRPPAGLGPAAPDHHAVLHHDRADGRIRPCVAEPAPTKGQRERHEALVSLDRHFGCGNFVNPGVLHAL